MDLALDVFLEIALELPAVTFLVAKNRDGHILSHIIDSVTETDDVVVMLDRFRLGFDLP